MNPFIQSPHPPKKGAKAVQTLSEPRRNGQGLNEKGMRECAKIAYGNDCRATQLCTVYT